MPEIAKFFSLWFGLVSNFIAPMTPSMVKLVHPCKYSWKKKDLIKVSIEMNFTSYEFRLVERSITFDREGFYI